MPSHYPLFRASGAPGELGRQHGEQAGEQIRAFLGFLAEGLKLSREQLQVKALRFKSLFDHFCPHLVEEIEGLAEGAKVSFEEALAAQIRGELGGLPDGGCTTFVIGSRGTADGKVLIGQNSDMAAEMMDFAYTLHLKPKDRPEILMWTFGGMLGYHGVNRAGVAHFANALGGGPAWKFALPHYPLKRLMLECRSLKEVNGLLREVPVCSNGNYVLCDGEGNIADVELTSEGPNVLSDDGAGFLVHSNHFLCAAHACEANFEQSLPDSFPRLKRLRELVAGKFGSITVEDMKRFLADHAGQPVGICRHPHTGTGDAILPNTGRTVASLIAEPNRQRLHVSRGNPCENAFVEYVME